MKAICVLLLIALAALLLATALAASADGPGYTLDWWTVDGGGTFNTRGGYSLGGTAGQPDASVWQGDGYTLHGGFWAMAAGQHVIYLPLVLRNY